MKNKYSDLFTFDFTQDKIEEVLRKFKFKPKISGNYMKNFAGRMVNLKTGETIPDLAKIRKVDWVFYSKDKPHKLMFFGYYPNGKDVRHMNKLTSFLTYKHKKESAFLSESESSWFYEHEFDKNLEYVKKQEKEGKKWENDEIKWLYEAPLFYSKKDMTYIYHINSLFSLLAHSEDDWFVDSVDFEKSHALQMYLGYPLLHEKDFKVTNKELIPFARNIWNALQK